MNLSIIENKIYEIKGQKVMLDFDLAELYETETKRLKEAVKRNANRFPADFMFELSKDEFETLRSQIASSKSRGGTRYLPFAFTEQGVAMLSSILNSEKAIEVNIAIVRAFVLMRQHVFTHHVILEKLNELAKKTHNNTKNIELVFQYLDELMEKKENPKPRRRVGYKHWD
jgi:phage regulator Rha-like protein